jgi:cephalosporin hydroxylase
MNKIQDGLRNPTVAEVFAAHAGRQIDKWEHYFDVYERHFAKYVGKSPRVLELGVDHGGSLQMWKAYFGPGAVIVGVDINTLSMFEEDQIVTIAADQTDKDLAQLGPFDIVIDDGSHYLAHQLESIRHLWPETTGVYLIEDCHHQIPRVAATGAIVYEYPWVIVYERAKRIIKGTPSRPLREDETAARASFAPAA